MSKYQKSNTIIFDQKNIADLANELSKPFKKISVIYPNKSFLIEKDRWISSITLWDGETSGLKIYPFMTDIAYRLEVGSLSFERVTEADPCDEFFELQDSFSNGALPQKIILNESEKRIETGIIMTAANDAKILIVPNAMPFTLAIKSEDLRPKHFEPEYNLEEYVIEDW